MEKPICKYCKNEMELDDKDFRFKGCCDYYWFCEKCGSALYQKERYGNICVNDWSPPNTYEVKEQTDWKSTYLNNLL